MYKEYVHVYILTCTIGTAAVALNPFATVAVNCRASIVTSTASDVVVTSSSVVFSSSGSVVVSNSVRVACTWASRAWWADCGLGLKPFSPNYKGYWVSRVNKSLIEQCN